ncbi:MAG: hypothetical protein M1821_004233 [Bathelium mastoideum]|nr:MAG: hypothetical protein M1821_004233 [Bathelium mastoideum]
MAVNTKTGPLRLEEMWEQATEDCYKLTAKDLKKKNLQPATFDSVKQQIENTPIEEDAKKSARDTKSKLKDATLDAVKCIKLLGGIAAQAASTTFPASGLCFNAVSFLLDAPFKIINMYEQLTELFQTVGTFLKQFKIFERIEKYSDIDPALLENVNQLLICFVRICALSIKLLHGGTREQLKIYLKKSLLDKDSGVGDELAELKRLSHARDSITHSLTLEAALKSDKKLTDLLFWASGMEHKMEDIDKDIRNATIGVDFLVDAERDKVWHKQLDDINTNLGIEKLLNDLDKQYRDAKTRQVKGTGSWLLEQDQFQQWIEPAAKGTQFLLLLGKKNVGKSFLIPAISEHIRAQKRDVTDQIALAKYCFPQDIDRSGNKLPQVQQAFKCLAYQLAQENKVYAKELAVICKAELNQLSGKELWKKLKFEEAAHGTTFIIILDGIDQLLSADEELFSVLADLKTSDDASSSGLRILLSGPRSSMVRSIEREPAIEVAEHNSEDVKKYIERSLEGADVLRGDEEEVVNLRKLVTEKLPTEAGNDFYKIDIAIREIGRQRYLDEAGVHRVLDKAGAEIKETIKRDLQQLNETLDPSGIKELNELLSWVLCFSGILRVDELKAAHALGHKKTAIRPLKKILKDDYGSIFEIDEDEYVDVPSEIQECLIFEKRQDNGFRMENEEGAQRTVTITKEEINMLRNFIKAFVDPETFEKFGFEAFFQGKGDPQVQIGINMTDAHTTVISALLDLFQKDRDEKTSELGSTALSELPLLLDPIGGIGKLSELDSEHKIKIGSGLIRFLSGRVNYWVGKYKYGTPLFWLEDDDALDGLWQWLKDSTVVKASDHGETEWIDRVIDPNAKYQLLRPVVLAYARHWLRDPSWDTWDTASTNYHLRNPVRWIQNYLTRERFSKKEIDKIEIMYRPTEDQIAASAKWAEKELNIEQQDSLWYERLGCTYLLFGERDDATKTFVEARKCGLNTTTTDERLAQAYAGLGEYAEAIKHMKDVVNDLKTVENPSEKDTDRLRGDVHDLIDWYSKTREPDIAMKWCEEALKYNKEKYRIYRIMIKTLFENNRIKEAADLLIEWSHQGATDYELSMLEAMQYDFAVYCVANYDYDDENDHFHAIIGLAQQIEKYDTVLGAMEKAIDFAKNRKEYNALGVLLLYRGNALSKSHLGKDSFSSALRHWHDCRVVSKRSGDVYVGFRATRKIGLYHVMEATNPQRTGDEQQEHVQTLEKVLKELKSDPNLWGSDDTAGYFEALLAIYYRSVGDDAKARQLLQREIKNYLDMLSDEWPENDWSAYRRLAVILARYGDDCNALSAWSLLPPSDAGSESPSPKRQGDMHTYCDGRCNTSWTYANDFWCCRYCVDVQFDSVCLEKLRAGTLIRDVCSPDHQFLHVPKWSDEEFRAVGKDRVRVGGEIQPDGTRTGGEIVTVEEWKNRLYEEWGIQKPAKKEEEEGKDKDAGEEVKEKDGEVKEGVSEEVTSLSTGQPIVVETSAS